MGLIGLFMAVLFVSAGFADTQAVYYVSPTGSDSNPGTEEKPFQTLAAARDAVRAVNSSMTGDIYVFLRGGYYPITQTITFEPQDSGTNGYRIYYTAYPGEVPVLSGGTQITGWTRHEGNIYKAALNRTGKLRTLIVNGKRAYMASKTVSCQGSWGTYSITAGQADWAWISGSKPDGVRYRAVDVPQLANAADVEIVNQTTWNQNIVCVREIVSEGSERIFKFQQPMGAIAMNQGWGAGFAAGGMHRIQNAYEFLDTPGEFYFDRASSTLYYYAGSENMADAVVYAPAVTTLIDICGTSTTNRVRNLTFKGLTFAYTEAELPQVAGSSGKTSCQGATWCKAFANTDWHADQYRAYDVMVGAIHVSSAESIHFIENKIQHIGNEGISLINDVSHCRIVGNAITDIGGSGIQIGHPQHIYEGDGGTGEKYPPSVEGVCRNNTIQNNLIYDTTTMYYGHAGITVYIADSLEMVHNHIEGTHYGGVSVGWGWCEFDGTSLSRKPGNPTTTCRNIRFNYNRVFDCMKTLYDSGAFYTIGAQPDSEASYNYVKAATTHFQGVYHPDEGTAWYTGRNLVFEIVPGQDNFELNDWGRKHDNHYDNIYSTSSAMQLGAPNCTVTNLHVYPNADWPPEALEIIEQAGLEPACRYLLPPPPTRSAYAQTEAENYDGQSGIDTETCSEGGLNVGWIENGDFLLFERVDFGGGANSVEVRAASATSGGHIEFRLDSLNGPLVGTCTVANTGGWQTWQTFSCPIRGASGVHTLYLKFTGGSGYLLNVNWFRFIRYGEMNGLGIVDGEDLPVFITNWLQENGVLDLDEDGVVTLVEFAEFAGNWLADQSLFLVEDKIGCSEKTYSFRGDV
jgi:hypothetical protein